MFSLFLAVATDQIWSAIASQACISDTFTHVTGLWAMTHSIDPFPPYFISLRDLCILITAQLSLKPPLGDRPHAPGLILLPIMRNIKNTEPFCKLTRVWSSTNTVRSADSYAEYLAAATARGDGRPPASLANLVIRSMGRERGEGGLRVSAPSQTTASLELQSFYTCKIHSGSHQWPSIGFLSLQQG